MAARGQRVVYRSKHCPTCGRVGRFHTYCSNACKQKAYRGRKVAIADGTCKTVSYYLVEEFGEHKCTDIFAHLNSITGKRNQEHVNAALIDIIEQFAYKLNTARQSTGGR